MDLSPFLLAVEEVEKEHDETPFFVAGIALALFAVAIGIYGITRPAWGGSAVKPLMALGAVLVVATMAMTIYVS